MTESYPVAVLVDDDQTGGTRSRLIVMSGRVVLVGLNAGVSVGYAASPPSSSLALMAGALYADATRAGNTRRGRRLARQAAKVARAQKRAEAEEARS